MLTRIDFYKSRYERASVKLAAVSEARKADMQAATAVADSLRALNDINALSEGTPGTPQAPINLWAGAEAILQAADAKGGSK